MQELLLKQGVFGLVETGAKHSTSQSEVISAGHKGPSGWQDGKIQKAVKIVRQK